MVEFKVVVNDGKNGKSHQVEVSGHHANSLIGKKIGDDVDGIFVSLPGYKLQITGGTDRNGFPIGSSISSKLWVHENTLALWAISKNKERIIKDPNLVQLKFDIDKKKRYKLFILLKKTKSYKSRIKSLKEIIRSQELFW